VDLGGDTLMRYSKLRNLRGTGTGPERILWIHERIKNMLAEDIDLSCMTLYELMLTYQQISTWKVLNTVPY
jgi:hypothetical protein